MVFELFAQDAPLQELERSPILRPPALPKFQSNLPPELLKEGASQQAKQLEDRFLQDTISPELVLNIAMDRPKILRFKQTPLRIFLPDEQVATAQLIDPASGREVAVQGLRPGNTTMTLWFKDAASPEGEAIISYLVRVFADPLENPPRESLQREINEKFPNSYVELDEIGGKILVKGQAPSGFEMVRILEVIAGARGVQTSFRYDIIQTRVETSGNNSAASNNTTSTTTTVIDTDPLASQDQAAARRRALDDLALAQAGIINLMRIPGEQQVMLRVTVAEVNRTAARSIGLNFSVTEGGNIFRSTAGGVTGNIIASLDMGQVNLAIDALRRLNLSRTLAEPNLVTMNGQPAEFRAGGRFPIPTLAAGGVGGGQNLQGVSFVPFGVQLSFTPLVQDRDVIRLSLQAEVSTRDESLGTSIGGAANGTSVSGLTSRDFSTTVELRSGQTLAVAGLLQTNFGSSSQRVPLWGDLPLIGATGGANRTSGGEQELVILVTPELVAPVDSCNQPALPGSDVYEPTDIEFFLANRLESRRSRDYRSTVRTDYARIRRPDRCCPDKFLVGKCGPTDRCCNQPAPVNHSPLTRANDQSAQGIHAPRGVTR